MNVFNDIYVGILWLLNCNPISSRINIRKNYICFLWRFHKITLELHLQHLKSDDHSVQPQFTMSNSLCHINKFNHYVHRFPLILRSSFRKEINSSGALKLLGI